MESSFVILPAFAVAFIIAEYYFLVNRTHKDFIHFLDFPILFTTVYFCIHLQKYPHFF